MALNKLITAFQNILNIIITNNFNKDNIICVNIDGQSVDSAQAQVTFLR